MITRLKTKIAFLRTQRHLKPTSDFQRALWLRLEQEMGGVRTLSFWQLHRVASAGILSLVFCVAGGGTAAYAYTNPSVTPNNPLYGVRLSVEQVESSLAVTSAAKAKAQQHRLQHRVTEAEQVVGDEKTFNKALAAVENELSENNIGGKDTDSESVLKFAEKVDDQALQKLQNLVGKHPEAAAAVVNKVIVDNAHRLESALPKAQNEKEKQFLQGRLDQRTKALDSVIQKISDQQKTVVSGTPKYEHLDQVRIHLEDERDQTLQAKIE